MESRLVVVQLVSHICLFATPWTAARQASLSFTISQSLLKLMSIELVIPSNHPPTCWSPYIVTQSLCELGHQLINILWEVGTQFSSCCRTTPSDLLFNLLLPICRLLVLSLGSPPNSGAISPSEVSSLVTLTHRQTSLSFAMLSNVITGSVDSGMDSSGRSHSTQK